MPKNKVPIWSHCNQCARLTKHDCIAEKAQDHQGFFEDFDWIVIKTSKLIECRGCEEISLRVDWWHSDTDWNDQSEFYPPRVSRRLPSWVDRLPDSWQSMLKETYKALHADSRRLAIMGARTLVDMYMNDSVGDVGGFEKKMNSLVSEGHLGDQDKTALVAALEAGHAAAHRGFLPESEQVAHVMDIVENLLQKHALRRSATELTKKTPPRLAPTPKNAPP
ncbi:DUF4145 domain-containing protein [Pseudomonas sp. NPDC090755]|uniref:DUF4145 domain-containing protein n=1 Tax=Pseudomonas sp. NPDC090755 TaxID=3364481 RepID=UPI00383A0FF2